METFKDRKEFINKKLQFLIENFFELETLVDLKTKTNRGKLGSFYT